MTSDDLQRSLDYHIIELRVLSDAIYADMRAALARNVRLDDPTIIRLQQVRAHVDGAVTFLVQAQTHSVEHGPADSLAEDFAELEDTSSSIACPEIDRASGTQEAQD